MTPEVTAALISVVISAIVGYLMAERAARREFERDVERVRTEFMAERVARELLSDPRWPKRSFEQIKNRLGGFDDDELRKILVRAGAIRFYLSKKKTEAQDDKKELWGLSDRNREEDEDGG